MKEIYELDARIDIDRMYTNGAFNYETYCQLRGYNDSLVMALKEARVLNDKPLKKLEKIAKILEEN